MSSAARPLPLGYKLSSQYLMFGLGAVLAIVGLLPLLVQDRAWVKTAPLAAAGPLLVLLIGTYWLKRTSRVHDAIESQLARIATVAEKPADLDLTPLAYPEPLAKHWNSLVRRLEKQSVLSHLEERLLQGLGDRESSRWKCVFDAHPDGLALCDADSKVIVANRSLLALLCQPEDGNIVGRPIVDVLREGAPQADLEGLDAALRKAESCLHELWRGDQITHGVLRVRRSRIDVKDSTTGYYVWSVRDVTQQRLAEEARDQFLFTATHELRTPLANLIAYAELLMDLPRDAHEQQKQFYNTIMAESKRLSRLVDDLLSVSQIESGSMTLTRHETDVARLVQEVIEHVQPQIAKRSQQFESRVAAKLPKLHVDKDKVAAALVNLLGNAVKYTPEEGRVCMTVESDAGAIRFKVEDTGFGIAQDEVPKLFQKFFRSSDQRVRDVCGSGLGLAFSYQVARLHGGDITVSSKLNEGSVFTLVLPVA